MTKRTGFTLIELIVVILILGILAAVAVPRFINLKSQANVAALMGLRAAVISAADLAHGLQLAAGLASNGWVTMEGLVIRMYGEYPEGLAGGIDRAVRFDTSTFRTSSSWPMVFQVTGATDPNRCQFTYYNPISGPPAIVTTADNC